MTNIFRALLCSVALALPIPVAADEIDETRLKELVLEAIRENPEIVMEAVGILQEREEAERQAAAAEALNQNADLLNNDPNAPVMGNPEGDVTVVEFFDYNCGYCRRVFADVKTLISEDANVRLVMREWPILGDESIFAARAALASREQGKYAEFHDALMQNRGRASEETVMKVAESIGLDTYKLRADMDAPEVAAHIETSHQLSQSLGITGTPGFVFGETLVPGLIELSAMKELLEEARAIQ